MLKHLFSLFAVVSFMTISVAALGQNSSDIDKRLFDKFSKKELKVLSADELNYWTFYLENSIEIVDIPKEKPDAVPSVVSLKSLDKKDINVFKLGFKPHAVARDYFRIEGTGKMIIVLPQSEIDQRYQAHSK
jgi:hypothetical protein